MIRFSTLILGFFTVFGLFILAVIAIFIGRQMLHDPNYVKPGGPILKIEDKADGTPVYTGRPCQERWAGKLVTMRMQDMVFTFDGDYVRRNFAAVTPSQTVPDEAASGFYFSAELPEMAPCRRENAQSFRESHLSHSQIIYFSFQRSCRGPFAEDLSTCNPYRAIKSRFKGRSGVAFSDDLEPFRVDGFIDVPGFGRFQKYKHRWRIFFVSEHNKEGFFYCKKTICAMLYLNKYGFITRVFMKTALVDHANIWKPFIDDFLDQAFQYSESDFPEAFKTQSGDRK